MNWMEPACKMLAGAGLVLGLIAPVSDVLANERPCRPYYQCPPGYRQMAPSSPYYMPSAPPSSQGETPEAPQGADQRPRTEDQQTQDQQQQPQVQQQDFTPSPDTSSRASLAPGANTPQLGRLDQANRLNLFDNMAAAPQNRVWFGFQYSSGINTGITPTSSFLSFVSFTFPDPIDQAEFFSELSGITGRQKQINYRVGAEVLLTCDMSIAVQGQYFTNETSDTEAGGFGDDFSNPQIMLKYVLARDCDTILSATLGVTPETSVDKGDFNENTTKIYPGMLYYETISPDLFTQGGFQFGIPVTDDQITTFDWSVSLGYWLYRDCNLGNCCCNSGITGIIPQINLLGKHTVGDDTRTNAFGFSFSGGFDPDNGGPISPFSGAFATYVEPQHVLDLSVGTLIMIGCDVQVGVGYSFPITSDETRESEFLSYVNYLF
jgi:hypothetical protein